jgi:uncharacterized membrane protein YkoI
MKIKMILCSAVATAFLVGCACEKNERSENDKQAKLMAEASVSKDDAQKTALATVPSGTVKEAELEKEHGKLVWSFDIITPDSKDITEVQVDARTGVVVGTEKETAGKDKD